MFAANITVTCSYHTFVSSTSFGDTMHLTGNISYMQSTPLWSVGTFIFLPDLYVWALFSALAACFCNEMC